MMIIHSLKGDGEFETLKEKNNKKKEMKQLSINNRACPPFFTFSVRTFILSAAYFFLLIRFRCFAFPLTKRRQFCKIATKRNGEKPRIEIITIKIWRRKEIGKIKREPPPGTQLLPSARSSSFSPGRYK